MSHRTFNRIIWIVFVIAILASVSTTLAIVVGIGGTVYAGVTIPIAYKAYKARVEYEIAHPEAREERIRQRRKERIQAFFICIGFGLMTILFYYFIDRATGGFYTRQLNLLSDIFGFFNRLLSFYKK